jgi:hypothetical protein
LKFVWWCWNLFVRSLAALVSLASIRLAAKIIALRHVPPPPTPTVIEAPVTDEDEAWIKRAHEARMSQLETVRGTAKDWASTITAVTGALSIVALIKGPEDIGRLTKPWEIAVGVVLLVGVLLALRGIFLAAVAAQGTPSSFAYSPVRYHLHYIQQLGLAALGLRVSRILVVLATLALIAAVGMTWYGEEDEKEGALVYAVSKDGTVACGEVSAGGGGVLLIKESDNAQPARFAPETVLTLVPVGKCPP